MKILIVEDDPQTIEAVGLIFKLKWPQAEAISTRKGSEAAAMVEKEKPDVVMLDIGLPDMSGLDVLKEIRTFSNVPVLIVTGHSDAVTQVKGLELGADDYVTKPFEPGVLLARIRNALRHGQAVTDVTQEISLNNGNLKIDTQHHKVFKNGNPVALTPTEYNLLYQLVKNEGKVLTRQMLLSQVWGSDEYNPDVVKKYIGRLREKLEDNPSNPVILLSEWGIGYKFVNPRSN